MATFRQPDQAEIDAYNRWANDRPEAVRAVALKFNPWTLYRMKSTGNRVVIYSFGEPLDKTKPVTLTVAVLGDYNLVAFERRVFGIAPEDLEECELPGPDEEVGALLTDEASIMAYIEAQR